MLEDIGIRVAIDAACEAEWRSWVNGLRACARYRVWNCELTGFLAGIRLYATDINAWI